MNLSSIIEATGRRLVISDVHGCFKTLRKLVEEGVKLTSTDQLYFLGDYIDRGPNSSGVIDYILELMRMGYNIFPLRGNHEQNLLNAIGEYDAETLTHYVSRICKSPDLLDGSNRIKSKYVDFFQRLEFYYSLNDFVIVHAGLNLNHPNPFEDRVSMLELRNPDYSRNHLNGKRIVHGHQVTPLCDIVSGVREKASVIPLDNGCFYTKPHKIYDHEETGYLCCLNLDSFELIIQKNIEEI